jgi:hypothetical protein
MKIIFVGYQWLMFIILSTQEAEIRRIMVLSRPRQIVCETLFEKNTKRNRAGGVDVVVEYLPSKCKSHEFKLQYHQK